MYEYTCKQIWYFAGCKEIIDEDQKLFIWHLGISEQEYRTNIL